MSLSWFFHIKFDFDDECVKAKEELLDGEGIPFLKAIVMGEIEKDSMFILEGVIKFKKEMGLEEVQRFLDTRNLFPITDFQTSAKNLKKHLRKNEGLRVVYDHSG